VLAIGRLVIEAPANPIRDYRRTGPMREREERGLTSQVSISFCGHGDVALIGGDREAPRREASH